MGGYGSGRPARYPKSEQMKRLDIAHLERRGYLRGGPYRYTWSWGGWRARWAASAMLAATDRAQAHVSNTNEPTANGRTSMNWCPLFGRP